ncbi:putative f-box domain-containing protein [Diaporthe ampelina]|uniref:Putative f-box domain-containing protein n=1 Tax=Diaporthe ampelina TaxID=1214573 RepID=A0A0G2FLA8_9PEZI|nr:putative f-box domain-containing protein [Diaporthe ampelina]
MDIVELPRDLFLLVVAHLSARTIVLCRRVSRSWHGAFADPDLNLQLMKWHFPRCREMREAYLAGALGGPAPAGADKGQDTADGQGSRRRDENENEASGDGAKAFWSPDWTVTFANVARRYHHLRTATPWTVEAIKLGSTEYGPSRMFYAVAIWDRFLRLDDKTAPFHYPDPAWSYSQEDGLLIYHSAAHEDTTGVDQQTASCPWRLRDLETGQEVVVPFPQGEDRIVRRVRLCDRVLVLEWCEREAYHQLNDREECHRHFVTALDIVRVRSAATPGGKTPPRDHTAAVETWAVMHRCQFKTHFLGFPLNRHDRFFSAHTATHYAVYVWQPNRSLYNDDPIESVIVWDISARGQPRTIRRITWDTLAFYGVRQGSTPTLRSLGMDERNLYFLDEEHRWAEGGHSSLVPPRVHLVRSTGIPVVVPEIEATGTGGAEHAAGGDGAEVVVQGPRWVDQCGTNTDVSMPFCTRTSEARLGGSAEQQHTALVAGGGGGEWPTGSGGTWGGDGTVAAAPSSPAGGDRGSSRGSSRSKGLAGEIEAGIAAGTSRWPGWAPCWRHEDFPYLSVGEVVDFRAGVRVTARHCFMLETLSVHVRPSISVVELGVGGDDELGRDEGGSSSDGGGGGRDGGATDASAVAGMARLERKLRAGMARRKLQKRKARLGGDGGEAADGGREDDGEGAHEEVQFADDMWERLLGKGCISGDERWLIGEDGKGTLSVVRF